MCSQLERKSWEHTIDPCDYSEPRNPEQSIM